MTYDRGVTTLRCFFFNDTATTEIYTLSLHDALPICPRGGGLNAPAAEEVAYYAIEQAIELALGVPETSQRSQHCYHPLRSEEHTSELQSRQYLVCRLLLEKKNKTNHPPQSHSSYYAD